MPLSKLKMLSKISQKFFLKEKNSANIMRFHFGIKFEVHISYVYFNFLIGKENPV